MEIRQKYKNFSEKYPKTKKIVGVILILVGLLALVTPFTPGSWLVFVGLEFIGIRLAAWQKIKARLNDAKGNPK